MEDNSTWRSVINLKYGSEDGGWFPSTPKGCHGVGLWKEISKEGMLLRHHCSVKIGDGSKARFWEDWWCGEAPLCSSFPSLYSIASSKGARVADLWVFSGSEGGWNFSFGRHFHDWELEEIQGFLCIVNSKSINPNLSDRLWWKEAKNGSFSIKTCFDLLERWKTAVGAYKDVVEPYCSHEGRFLCLGSLVGQDFDHGSA